MSQINGLVYRPLGPDPLAVNINQSDKTANQVAVNINQSDKTAGGDTLETAANDAFGKLMNASPIVLNPARSGPRG